MSETVKSDFETTSINDHWKYLREAIRDGRNESNYIHLTITDYLAIIGYHYKTAMLHGYKHGTDKNE